LVGKKYVLALGGLSIITAKKKARVLIVRGVLSIITIRKAPHFDCEKTSLDHYDRDKAYFDFDEAIE